MEGGGGVLEIAGVPLTPQSCIIHHCKVALVNILNMFMISLYLYMETNVCPE